ncbi:hypothetical protein B0J18DRAFT_485034 [Chaetomium sp. MPI-SDFR-AT-0129]|nr:hypothetical protein B0J18DRAFT_485034 [Chaetomium sp. MPI-SDFR-AT-0129]
MGSIDNSSTDSGTGSHTGSSTSSLDYATEPIAIVGLSCKFAGEASSPSGLWNLMTHGRNAWTPFPASRFHAAGAYHPDSQKLGTTSVKGAHFMTEDPALFDANFFQFSGEAAAAVDPHAVAGSNTSVYSAVFMHDYHEGIVRDGDNLPRFEPIGTLVAMSANRISHFFDLRGASFTLDTGCSGALVALHQAVLGLRAGEADMAVVSGVNVMLAPDQFKTLTSLGMLSPDGKSYALDARANGYGRGEGVGTIVVKRLRDALAAGDPVRAVIRETALNQDGKTETITTPSEEAQVELMRECYRRAGLSPSDTQYFELHGTGTPTGDPIEARAIAEVFGPGGPPRKAPLRVGSVKTNIGHTEAASGLASVIKVVLALEKGQLPPTANFETPNPKLRLDEWNLKVATELEPWPAAPGEAWRASVNNFGYGGSNSHVILEGVSSLSTLTNGHSLTNGHLLTNGHAETNGHALTNGHSETETENSQPSILIFHGRDEQACKRLLSDTASYLQNHPNPTPSLLSDLSHTLLQHRTRFPTGWVSAHVVPPSPAGDLSGVITALESAPQFKPTRLPSSTPRIGMVFTGQGAQWYAMGRELISSYPVFKGTLVEAEGYLTSFGADWFLTEELLRDAASTRVNQTALSISICVAVQIALVRLLATWGIKPTAVTSHSSGEIAAAYAAGGLTLREAMACAYYRSSSAALTPRSGPKGAMAAIGVGETQAAAYLARLTEGTDGKAVVACVNSPGSVTVAGDETAVVKVLEMAGEEGVFARRLKVDTGYHSHHMEPIAGPYRKALLGALATQKGDQPKEKLDVMFSSPVTGGRVTEAKQLADPEHWVGSLLQPVEFVRAFTDMVVGDPAEGNANVDIILEVGPHTALGGPIKEISALPAFEGLDLPYLGCLTRHLDARECMLTMALTLIRKGYPVDLSALTPISEGQKQKPRVLTDLPSYPWNHANRHWAEARVNQAYRERDQPPHHLLGSPVPGANPEAATWRQRVRVGESPWLRDHVVQGNILYPGAGYICLAIEAMKQLSGGAESVSGYKLRDIEIHAALVVPDNADGIEIQTVLRTVSDKTIGARGWKEWEILSVTQDSHWTQHAKGLITVDSSLTDKKSVPNPLEGSGYTRRIDPEDMWSSLRKHGMNHGPLFRNTTSIIQDGSNPKAAVRKCVTTIEVAVCDVDAPVSTHLLHPTTLDSVVIASYAALPGGGVHEEGARVPVSIRGLWVSGAVVNTPGHGFACHTTMDHLDAKSFQADVTVVDPNSDSVPVLEVEGLVCQSLGRSFDAEQQPQWTKDMYSKVHWAPDLLLSASLSSSSQAAVKGLLAPQRDLKPKEKNILTALRRLCVYFCQEAIQSLTEQDIANLQPHHVKYLTWMKSTLELAASGSLGPNSDKWTSDSPLDRERTIAFAESKSADGQLICRLGPLLGPILRGEQAPLEVMMADKMLFNYEANAVRFAPGFEQLAALVKGAVHKHPRARVLEIGAGAGGATRHVLRALGSESEPFGGSWHFTDVSSGFFEAARDEFASQVDMEFGRLDIEQDPTAQGFQPESYDIVVASRVLHATKGLVHTLENVRKLLKPGGSLVMMEMTQDQVDVQFVYGLLPGWWLGEEPERQKSASLDTAGWESTLKQAGFKGVELELRDYDAPGQEGQYSLSSILASVPAAGPSSSDLLEDNGVVVVTSAAAPPPDTWLQTLRETITHKSLSKSLPAVQTLESLAANSCAGKFTIFLGEAGRPLLNNLSEASWNGIRTMLTTSKGVLWVTRGGVVECADPDMALANGFLRVIRNEYVGRSLVTLDLDAKQPEWVESDVDAIVHVMAADGVANRQGPSDAEENEFAVRDGLVMVPRIYKDGSLNKMLALPDAAGDPENTAELAPLFQDGRPLSLKVGMPGFLDSLVFDDPHEEHEEWFPEDDAVVIEPRAYGVNARDVMVAMGQVKDKIMGVECAGIITALGPEAAAQGFALGDRVMALLRGPFGSSARITWQCVSHIPEGMAFEDAASLLLVSATAYVGLVDVARLWQGQSVLINGIADPVGQAAIMLAKDYLGAEVYVTVDSQEEREFVEREYDLLPNHIFTIDDASSLKSDILSATGNRGVSVVFNSLSGPSLQAAFDVLAPFGHFIEAGKRDAQDNSLLEMSTFSRVASFTSVDILALAGERPSEASRVINEVARLATQNVIRPIRPVTVFPLGQISKAMRLVQTEKHLGKVVLSVSSEEQVPALPRVPTPKLKADASYLIVGGVGGLGRPTAFYLAAHGAKNIIVLSRSAGNLDPTSSFVTGLRDLGCRVVAVSCDVSDPADLNRALDLCSTTHQLPPIRGVIQGATVLRDSVLENLTLDDWRASMGPKVTATWNLHHHFADKNLDFFIIFSSLSGIFGWASQGNYAAGGTFQDALAHYRNSQNLPAVSLDIGWVKGVGASSSQIVSDGLGKSGQSLALSDEDVMRAVGMAILHPFNQPQMLVGLNSGPGPQWDVTSLTSPMGRDARFGPLRYRPPMGAKGQGQAQSGGAEGDVKPLSALLKEAGTVEEARAVAVDAIAVKLADIFMREREDIDLKMAPSALGVDSLVAVELRNMLMLKAGADVPMLNVLQSVSLEALAGDVVARSSFVTVKA